MKKSIRQAIILAMVMILAVTSTALADTIVSSSFKFNSVMEQPEETPTVEPEAEATEEVTEEPAAEPTEEVVEEPVETEEPATEPTEEVVEEPVVTEEPATEPTEEVTEEPAAEPTEEVTEEPAAESTEEVVEEPEISLTVTSNLAGKKAVLLGTEMVLTLTVDGAEGCAYTIQWQSSADGGATWTDVPGATEHQLKVILMQEHAGLLWRASINIPD